MQLSMHLLLPYMCLHTTYFNQWTTCAVHDAIDNDVLLLVSTVLAVIVQGYTGDMAGAWQLYCYASIAFLYLACSL